jgi:hypothetical protein
MNGGWFWAGVGIYISRSQSILVVSASASNPPVAGSSHALAPATLCDYQRPSVPVSGQTQAGQCSPFSINQDLMARMWDCRLVEGALRPLL